MEVVTVKGETSEDNKLYFEYKGKRIPVREVSNKRGKQFRMRARDVVDAGFEFGLYKFEKLLSFTVLRLMEVDIPNASLHMRAVVAKEANINCQMLTIKNSDIMKITVKAALLDWSVFNVIVRGECNINRLYRSDMNTIINCEETSRIDRIYTDERGFGLHWVKGCAGKTPRMDEVKYLSCPDTLVGSCMNAIIKHDIPFENLSRGNLPKDILDKTETCFKCNRKTFRNCFKIDKTQILPCCVDLESCRKRRLQLPRMSKVEQDSIIKLRIRNAIDISVLAGSSAKKGYTKRKLVAICGELGLINTGSKSEVVQTLIEYLLK